LELAVLGLAETKDDTSRVESEVASLRAAMFEEVRRETSRLKAQLSDCCPKAKKDLTNLEQELLELKDEIGEVRQIRTACHAAENCASGAIIAARPAETREAVPPRARKRKLRHWTTIRPKKRGGNVRDRHVVEVTSGVCDNGPI
jgi:DNA repair exonuclease SbcCD ATPase subunit